jgi:hypothetical protein
MEQSILIAVARADLVLSTAWAVIMSPYVRFPLCVAVGVLIGRCLMRWSR